MRVSLSTSLHLDHGLASFDQARGDTPPMQAFVPMGLLSLKAAADRALGDQQIRVIELNGLINRGVIENNDHFYENLVNQVWRPDDDFFGLMTDADSLPHTVLTAYRLKERSPHAHVCLGGPAVSPISALVLDRFPFIDSVCRGESEATFCELLEVLELRRTLEGVKGLTWRAGDRVIENPERPIMSDVDELPIPDFDSYDMALGAPLYLDVGRGCPFKCQFCATAPFWNRRYRMKSIDRIVTEMILVRDRYGRKHINFSHDIFTCDKAWTLAFSERLIAERLGVTWSCSTRTDIISPEILTAIAQAGCTDIYYGIETGSPLTQKDIEKALDLDWCRHIVQVTREVGIRATTGFIVGHPTETLDTLKDTLNCFFEFLQIGGHRAHLFALCPFHGAPMFSQYASTITRAAEYSDVPLTESPAHELSALRRENPDIFASAFRYETPNVPAALVDASEEISCHLVVLKSLWPLLLPYYASALEMYSRWAHWIAAYNKHLRPHSALVHQGNAHDLLNFVDQELERLDLQTSDIAELSRYERNKLKARDLRDPSGDVSDVSRGHTIETSSVLALRCHYFTQALSYDLSALLSGRRASPISLPSSTFALFAKTSPGYVDTLQIGRAGKHLLELAERPQTLGALVHRLNEQVQLDDEQSVRLVSNFHKRGLLTEIEVHNALN